jgi:lipid-binding SYLF domain-containing protein
MTSHRTMRLMLATTVALSALGAARASVAADDDLIARAQQTMAAYEKADPDLSAMFRRAAAYAVFPGVGKGGYWVGGAHGTGVLFENGAPTGKVKLNQVSIGAQFGGQEFSEVVFLESPSALADFKRGKLEMSAQASAVALNSGAAAAAKYRNGVAVVIQSKGGLMAEAAVGGQKFSYTPFSPAHQ